MSWSLGETKTLAVKAARGAGMSWGLADEAGFAVRWLQAQGAPGVQALADYLTWREITENRIAPVTLAGAQSDALKPFSPIELGAALMDAGRNNPADLGWVCQPLLLTPFIAACSTSTPGHLIWEDTEILASPHGFATSAQRASLLIAQAECRLTAGGGKEPTVMQYPRVPDTENDHIKILEKFAARTYAPATELSRLAGAGAGLHDND